MYPLLQACQICFIYRTDLSLAGRASSGGRPLTRLLVEASGLLFPVTQLVGYPDGYWGSQVTFCVPHDATVLVLDTVTVVGAA